MWVVFMADGILFCVLQIMSTLDLPFLAESTLISSFPRYEFMIGYDCCVFSEVAMISLEQFCTITCKDQLTSFNGFMNLL